MIWNLNGFKDKFALVENLQKSLQLKRPNFAFSTFVGAHGVELVELLFQRCS